jgi:hypothetical protein
MRNLRPALSLFFASIAVFWCRALYAQQSPPSEAQKLGFTFSNELVLSSDAELRDNETAYRKVAVQDLSWNLSQAIPLRGNRSATIGLGYNLIHTSVVEPGSLDDKTGWNDFKQSHPKWNQLPVPNRLQSLTATLDYSQEVNERWSFSSSGSVGSYVTKTGLLSRGWGVGASALGLYKWDSELTLAVGASYESLSSDFRFIPIIGFDWRLSDKWSMALGFPSTAVTYQLRKNLTFSLGVSGSGGVYYVKDDPQPGATSRSLAGSRLETMEARLGFKVEWQLNDRFSVNCTSGDILYREFKYIDRDYKLKSHDMVSFLSVGGSCSF